MLGPVPKSWCGYVTTPVQTVHVKGNKSFKDAGLTYTNYVKALNGQDAGLSCLDLQSKGFSLLCMNWYVGC